MCELQKFIVIETAITEKETVVYAKNQKEAYQFYCKGINDSPKKFEENKSLEIKSEGVK